MNISMNVNNRDRDLVDLMDNSADIKRIIISSRVTRLAERIRMRVDVGASIGSSLSDIEVVERFIDKRL